MNLTCPLCQPTPYETLWQDDFCRVVLLNDTDYPAYCRVELLGIMAHRDQSKRSNVTADYGLS